MLVALTSIAVLYFLFLLLLRKGWKKTLHHHILESADRPWVTVVIAARNESANIAAVLGDLERQAARNFDVILVDDHSEDDTVAIAQAFCENSKFPLDVVSLDTTAGKKAAVTTGVYRARGSIIITTDADCRVGPHWIESIVLSFEPHVKFVSAGVRIGPAESLRAELQAAEFASLVSTGASAIGIGYPVMCNGANMAFRRDAFLEVGGYSGNDHIPSGDDVFLLRKIHSRYPGSVVFCPRSEAVVETAAVSWRNFISQRVRWGAKWRNSGSLTTALSLFVGLVHLSWLVLLPALILAGSWIEPVSLFLIKAFLEMLYLRDVHRFLGLKWSARIFLLLQLTYSLYVVSLGILANFKTAAWKGRKISRAPVEIHSRLADNR
jgi:cellulose synthase/poly-beta-1,6-N-acetylglucosamine synthase-like glycosyltransferase